MSAIKIRPTGVSLGPGESRTFEAVDETNGPVAVVWSVVPNDPAMAGSIDETGVFRAPLGISEERSIMVQASDKSDPSRTATATLVLRPAIVEPPALPTVKVSPETAVLGAGQSVKFQAADARGNPVSVSWSLSSPHGSGVDTLGTLENTTGELTVYTAPEKVLVQRFIVITATGTGESDKAMIVLAPGKVSIVPAEVALRAGERQLFQARVSGDPDGKVIWTAPSPTLGSLDERGEYVAPNSVREDQAVTITAIAKVSGEQAGARIVLLADPWSGWAPRALGAWLLTLFLIVVCVYYAWPPPLESSELNAAKSAQATAQQVREQRQADVAEAKQRATMLAHQLTEATKGSSEPNPALRPEDLQRLTDDRRRADESVMERTAEESVAALDLRDKNRIVELEQERASKARSEERRVFLLVVLAGALGSFVHVTRSFVDFVGNRRLRPSWAWWYLLQPFTGSALAVVVYLVLRGGFFMGTSAGGIINPFGFVAVACLVGLFSKQATSKLDELFSTMFRTDKEPELKDKLNPEAKHEQ